MTGHVQGRTVMHYDRTPVWCKLNALVKNNIGQSWVSRLILKLVVIYLTLQLE
jgi:hypothetical protein